MMYKQIKFTKTFEKQFKKLEQQQKDKFYQRIYVFEQNPHDRILRNHALKGRWVGFRSIDIANDLRALYYEDGEKIVFFAYIGSHSQLY